MAGSANSGLEIEDVILERTRYKLLRELAKGPRRAANLNDLTGVKMRLVVYHVGILRKAKLVVELNGEKGRSVPAYRLTDRGKALVDEYGLDR